MGGGSRHDPAAAAGRERAAEPAHSPPGGNGRSRRGGAGISLFRSDRDPGGRSAHDALANNGPSLQAPSLAARSSRLLAAMSTGAVGAASPVPGPRSFGREMWAVRNPHLAAASRSLVWAATIMQSPGDRSSASQAER